VVTGLRVVTYRVSSSFDALPVGDRLSVRVRGIHASLAAFVDSTKAQKRNKPPGVVGWSGATGCTAGGASLPQPRAGNNADFSTISATLGKLVFFLVF
jgi:hypothetical protein